MKGPAPVLPPDAAEAAQLAHLDTPAYVFDPHVLAEDHAALKAALGTPLVVSLKACPVVDLLARSGPVLADGIELASLGELNLTVGRVTAPRYVNTPVLDATLAESAAACRATLVADSLEQLRTIIAAAERRRVDVQAALRVNAQALLGTLSGEAGRRLPVQDHFGMEPGQVLQALQLCQGTRVRVLGLHVHAGSNQFAAAARPLARAMALLLAELRAHTTVAIEFVNLGGGLPVDWRELDFDFAHYRHTLAELFPHVRVLHEAGRAVFARCGRFVTRVLALKTLAGQPYAVCDGGLAQCFLLAQTERVVKQLAQPRLIRAGAALAPHTGADGTPATTLVVGSSCNRADVIGRLPGPQPSPGDLLVFDDCGAYHSYSPTGFLNLRAAGHHLVS